MLPVIQSVNLNPDLQDILERVFQAPEDFKLELKGTKLSLFHYDPEALHISSFDLEIPSNELSPLFKIKSWRLFKSKQQNLSLSLNLTI